MKTRHLIVLKTGIAAAALLLAACRPPPPATTLISPEELAQQVETSQAPLMLVHVWATWCAPCREEFPELLAALAPFSNQALDVLLVSADDPADAQTVVNFLEQQRSPFGSLISTKLNEAFITALSPNWSGALPATFFYSNGKLLKEWEGKRDRKHMTTTLSQLLNQTKGTSP